MLEQENKLLQFESDLLKFEKAIKEKEEQLLQREKDITDKIQSGQGLPKRSIEMLVLDEYKECLEKW